MAAAPHASRPRSAQPLCWLLGIALAALAWAFGCLTVPLLAHLSDLQGEPRALLIAAVVLCASTGIGLMFPAADAVRDRR